MGAGEIANGRVAPGTPLLLVDRADEAEPAAKPLSRIIARKMPSAIKDQDFRDAAAAGIVVVRYVWRQIRLYYEMRRATAADAAPQHDQEPPAA